ncbi:hypothetical protein [Devosia sp. LjRoot3]|uniref:hypothetical protein n=1 Tax=Devosia sp. LjRoot3 TaxID=3342319 RepID=UPI003ED17383
MNQNYDLDLIARADIDLPSARVVVASILDEGSDHAAMRILAAFRSWVWKALDDRRRDAELRGWYDLYRKVDAALVDDFPVIAAQIQTLYELIYESISVSELRSENEVLSKKHVVELLRYLRDAHGVQSERDTVGRDLGLNQSNLTRVINLASQAGLIEKTMHGRKVLLRLSRTGQERLAELDDAIQRSRSGKVVSRRHHHWRGVHTAGRNPRKPLQQPGLVIEEIERPSRIMRYVNIDVGSANFIETIHSMTVAHTADAPFAIGSTASKTRPK